MNKTLLVAALSALTAGTAFAQSSVTIYGRFNETAERITVNGVSTKQLVNNASRIGFRGTEDLGGGLRAGFTLEHGFSPDTGTPSSSAFWSRQSEVNLGGAFGTIRAGRFTSEAYYATADYVSMHNHDTGDSSDALYAYIGRNTNKIAYRLPTVAKGLSAEVAVSAGEGVVGQGRTWDGALNYQVGALALGAGYEKNGAANQFAVRALYDLGSFAFGGYIQRDKSGLNPTGNWGSRTNIRLAGAYILGASEFHLNVGKAGDYGNVKNSAGKQFTLGYNYNLSKRTKVYTYYTKTTDNGPHIYSGSTDGARSALAFGLRHNF